MPTRKRTIKITSCSVMGISTVGFLAVVVILIIVAAFGYGEYFLKGAITMNLSPDGTPWFTEWFAGKIGRVNIATVANIGFSIQNFSSSGLSPESLSSTQNLTLNLNIFSPSKEPVQLAVFLSTFNYSAPFAIAQSNDSDKSIPAFIYSFSPSIGQGNFTSRLTIGDQLLLPGTYYLTVSEITNNIHVSKVLQVNVP